MTTSRSFRLVVAVSLLSPVGIAAHARAALGCDNAVTYDRNQVIRELSMAEQAVGAGKMRAAVEAALRNYPRLHAEPRLERKVFPHTEIDPLGARAQRIAAMAIVRTDGVLTIGPDFDPMTIADRRANLEWAIAIVREYAEFKEGPASQTDLGEALSKLPETREEALRILDALDKKDLITSPDAYAALADLREGAGDLGGRDAALKRFGAMRRKGGGRAGEKG